MEFNVSLAQINSECGNVEKNLEKMCGLIETAASSDAKLVVFPEMSLCGYMVMDGKDFETFYRCVQQPDSYPVRKIASTASELGIHVVFGAPMENPARRGVIHNSAVLVEPSGKIHVYNKLHLPTGRYGEGTFFEHMYCKPGDSLKLCSTSLGKIGLQVCRDFAFPEAARAYCYAGADLIINISAAPHTSKPFFDMVLPVRAFENAAYLVYVNAAGEQRGVNFFGHSRIIDPLGRTLTECKTGEEDFKTGTINLEHERKTRMKNPILKDMLPFKLYTELTEKLKEETTKNT